jgi:hypothetical protein
VRKFTEETRALDNWGVMMLRGEDRYGLNKVQPRVAERMAVSA